MHHFLLSAINGHFLVISGQLFLTYFQGITAYANVISVICGHLHRPLLFSTISINSLIPLYEGVGMDVAENKKGGESGLLRINFES